MGCSHSFARPGRSGARLALVLLVSTVTIAACAATDAGDSGQDGDAQRQGGAGGEITIAQSSQPDHLDPALSYTNNGWEVLWLVYTPLLTYRHAEGEAGSELIPGLAEDLPEISADGKTYTLTLRDGLEYSDGTPVNASDFEHTIKRVLNLESGGAAFYEGIEGATEYLEQGDPEGDISGVDTDDETGEITIQLVEPNAAFSNMLAISGFAGLVPGDTPFEDLTADPPPGVGAYMITESVPNRQFVLERNPEFAALGIPDIPTGNLDKITTVIVKNAAQQAQDVLDNELDYMQDPPPADYMPRIEAQASDRYEEHATASTFYFFLNQRVPPFDDPLVREAVNYAIDKPALARLFGGRLQPGCGFIPPGQPGYNEAFDTTECPYGDPSQPPNTAKAQDLIRQAGAEGAHVTVWGNNEDPTDKATQAYAEMLNEIGLDAEPNIVDGGVYSELTGNAENRAQTGLSSWYQAFPHPSDFYTLVDGDSIQPTNNLNRGNIDDPRLNGDIDQLLLEPDIQAAAGDWSALDEYLVGPPRSYLAPYGHRKLATFLSERMDFEAALFHPVYLNDYSSWALKDVR
jgi:peptide/nickel transport system substrate-binding protein